MEGMKILRMDRLQGIVLWGRGVLTVVQSPEIDADEAVRSLVDAVDQGLKCGPVNCVIWDREDLEIP